MNIAPKSAGAQLLDEGGHLERVARSVGKAMGVAAEDLQAFADSWLKLSEEMTSSPKAELLFRLNARINGEDPGVPVNTGPSGWRL
jgi:hypothetical protein